MSATTRADLPILELETQDAWAEWLHQNHASSSGVWLRLYKKSARKDAFNHAEALEHALCFGWIDGQARSESEMTWLQKFTPRRSRSVWSKINRDKVTALIESGRMRSAGLREIERAKADGRWDAAYDSHATITVPPDLETAISGNPKAAAFFEALDSRNRYAVLHRIQLAKKPETRAKRIQQFVLMLEQHQKLHP